MTRIEIVRKALDETGHDIEGAVKLARKWIEDDPALYAEHIGPMIDAALDDDARYCLKQERCTLRNAQPSGETKMSATLREGHTSVAESRMMNWPLRGGKRIGDATKADLAAEASYAMKSGQTQLISGTWYESIAKRLKADTDVVKKHLSERQLRRLYTLAEGRVAG